MPGSSPAPARRRRLVFQAREGFYLPGFCLGRFCSLPSVGRLLLTSLSEGQRAEGRRIKACHDLLRLASSSSGRLPCALHFCPGCGTAAKELAGSRTQVPAARIPQVGCQRGNLWLPASAGRVPAAAGAAARCPRGSRRGENPTGRAGSARCRGTGATLGEGKAGGRPPLQKLLAHLKEGIFGSLAA